MNRWLLALFLAFLAKLLHSEAVSWLQSFQNWLISVAVRRLPLRLRTRFDEEWRGVLDDYNDKPLTRMVVAIGFLLATYKICHEIRFPNTPFSTAVFIRTLDVLYASNMFPLAILSAACALIRLRIRTPRGRKVLVRCTYFGRDFEPIASYDVPNECGSRRPNEAFVIAFAVKCWHVLRGDMTVVGGPAMPSTIHGFDVITRAVTFSRALVGLDQNKCNCVQDFLVEDRPISAVVDHLTGSLAEPKVGIVTRLFSGWQVCGL